MCIWEAPVGPVSAALHQRMLSQARCLADVAGLAACDTVQYQALRTGLELIKRLSYPHHWRVVRDSLWQAVTAAGLADAQVQAALSARLELLDTMPPTAPGYTGSTVRIRKDL